MCISTGWTRQSMTLLEELPLMVVEARDMRLKTSELAEPRRLLSSWLDDMRLCDLRRTLRGNWDMSCCWGEEEAGVTSGEVATVAMVAMDEVDEVADCRAEEAEPRLSVRMARGMCAWKKPLLLLSMELVRELADKPVTSLWDLDLLIAAGAAVLDAELVPVEKLAGEMGEIGETGVKVSEGADGGGPLVCGPWCLFRRRISIVGGAMKWKGCANVCFFLFVCLFGNELAKTAEHAWADHTF